MSDSNVTLSQTDLPVAPKDNSMSWMSFVPMILIFFVFYFLLIRPQEKKRRSHEQMLTTIKKGQNIVMSSGIYGVVSKVNDSDATVEIEVAKGVVFKILKSAIANITSRK